MLYLEDLKIGDRFISREYEITLDEIKKFANSYDPQPFHIDEEQAKHDPIFQGIAASGWHTSAITMRLWTELMPIKLLWRPDWFRVQLTLATPYSTR